MQIGAKSNSSYLLLFCQQHQGLASVHAVLQVCGPILGADADFQDQRPPKAAGQDVRYEALVVEPGVACEGQVIDFLFCFADAVHVVLHSLVTQLVDHGQHRGGVHCGGATAGVAYVEEDGEIVLPDLGPIRASKSS